MKLEYYRMVDKMKNIFVWDGSDVTEQLKNAKIKFCQVDKKIKSKYWEIKINRETLYCEVRSCPSILPAIIDEVKPIFGLQKVGTHWLTIGKKIYILIKPLQNEKGEIVHSVSLKDWPFDPKNKLFVQKVQDIYAFRQLLAVSCSRDGALRVVRRGKSSFPVSFYEPKMCPERDEKSVLPGTVLIKWFNDDPELLEKSIRRITRIDTVEDIMDRVFEIRNYISETIKRIDDTSITYSDFIITRILNHIQATFKSNRQVDNPYISIYEGMVEKK